MKGSLQEIEKCKILGIGYCVKMLEKNMKCPFTCPFTVWIKKKKEKKEVHGFEKEKNKNQITSSDYKRSCTY